MTQQSLTNNEIGSIWALHSLGVLADAWPRTCDFETPDLVAATKVQPDEDVDEFMGDLFDWLKSEGFIEFKSDYDGVAYGVSITSRGLDGIGRTLGFDKKELGSKLKQIAADAASETGRAVIAETIGLLFGAAAKGLTGT